MTGRTISQLRLAREAAGLTRRQLAALAQISSRTLFAIEVEGRYPRPATRLVLVQALGLPEQHLFEGPEDAA